MQYRRSSLDHLLASKQCLNYFYKYNNILYLLVNQEINQHFFFRTRVVNGKVQIEDERKDETDARTGTEREERETNK